MANNHHLENIRILSRFRLVALVGQMSLILFSLWYFNLKLPLSWIASILATEIIFEIYVIYSIRKKTLFSIRSIFFHLLFDSLILSALIYFTGGTNNPFVYLLLLFMALASFMLSQRYLVLTAIMQLMLYSALNLIQRPLEYLESSPLESFHFHLIGMWINFILSIILIAIFGLLTRRAILKQEKQIQQMGEKQLQDEQILGLGIMSASAAHELGTPLSTMAIIVDDLQQIEFDSNYKEDFNVLAKQIKKCKQIIARLQQKSRFSQQKISSNSQDVEPQNLKKQLLSFFENWLIYRPQIILDYRWGDDFDQINFQFKISLEQAIINLLDNAADASLANNHDQINIVISTHKDQLLIDIYDFGLGISTANKKTLGHKIQNSAKKNGLGWGVFLSNVSIERVAGTVQLLENKNGGSITKITIPLAGKK